MSKQWQDFEANGVAYLQYSTAHDDKVRDSHAILEGLTMPADSNAWKSYWPPLDWNCRCHIIPGIEQNSIPEKDGGKTLKAAATNPLFANNQAVQKQIFSDDHPVYKSLEKNKDGSPKLKSLTAVKSYGLRPVEDMLNNYEFENIVPRTKGDFLQMWNQMEKVPGTDNIILKDKLDTNILFDSNPTGNSRYDRKYFKTHIFQNEDQRWEYANTFPEIVTDPDEIWSFRENNDLARIYLKFYNEGLVAVYTKNKAEGLVADTMYLLRPERYEELRRGALLYTKR